jgi:gas vesicle protein
MRVLSVREFFHNFWKGSILMGSFINGALIGLGLSLLFAPKKGEEMRHLIAERIGYLRGIPPENEELKQTVGQMSQRVQEAQQLANQAAQTGVTAQSYAQQVANKAGAVQRDLKNVTQQAGRNTPPAGPRR